MTASQKDLYGVLGLTPNASPTDIEAACLRLGSELREKSGKGNLQAALDFKEVERAFEILSNPESRRIYDESIRNIPKESQSSGKLSLTPSGAFVFTLGASAAASAVLGKSTSLLATSVVAGIGIGLCIYSYRHHFFKVSGGDAPEKRMGSAKAMGYGLIGFIAGMYMGAIPGMLFPFESSRVEMASENPSLTSKGQSKSASTDFKVTPIGYLENILDIERCRRESPRIVKCIVQAKGGASIVEGLRLSAITSRWDPTRQDFIGLPPGLVNAGTIGQYPAEITIMIPPDADLVSLTYR